MADDDNTSGGRVNRSRRALLIRLGLTAGAAYAAPVLLQLSQSRASGSGGGSGGGGGGGGGNGGGSGGSAPRSQARPRRPPPEIVVAASAADIDRIVQAGFTLRARAGEPAQRGTCPL